MRWLLFDINNGCIFWSVVLIFISLEFFFSAYIKEAVKIKLWNIPLLLFLHTFMHQSQRRKPKVQRGHNHLNDLSKWTMEWLHRTNRWHICCHHGSLGSHTSLKRKKRKMSPLTHFTEEVGQFYRSPHPSLSISCLGEGVTHTLTPVSSQGSCRGFC